MSGDALDLSAQAQLGETALDVSVRVEAGRCLALAGPSGAGKTSVLRVVAGLLRPHAGHVRCGDEVWLDTERRVARAPDRRRVGYLFQSYALFPHLRGWQNVAYPLRGLRRSARRARAVALLERFEVEHLADVRPGTYSGGESQRVALARTLARDPLVLLLDEPLSALDARTRASAGRTLKRTLSNSSIPTLVVTHDFNEAALLGDEIAIIDHGRILQQGSASELAAAPGSSFVADFTGAVVLTGTASPGPDGLTSIDLGDGVTILSTASGSGTVGASVYPWEIELVPVDAPAPGSAQNRLVGRVVSSTTVANRVRVTVDAGQPVTAEVTDPGAEAVHVTVGEPVALVWKASATRLIAR
jgi:molybdate transport system ATP-binding protein